jgi:hypothetical protein
MRISLFGFLLLAAASAGANEADGTIGPGHMRNCPTAVEGAATDIKETADAVVVTVTGKGAPAAAEIRKRAQHVVAAAKNDPTAVLHTGDGHGGGGLGRCEVVLKDTTVTAENVEGGSRITVKPVKPVDLEWLKKETRARRQAHVTAKKGG